MVRVVDVEEFLSEARSLPVLDVRSPGEFGRGHIPGAINGPLFTDEERAAVGTLYKQQGREAAVLEGLRYVGPRLATMVEQARALAPAGRILVHCWRGGERSGSVAWLFDKSGVPEVFTLRGGYKAFRRHVQSSFTEACRLLVLGGFTGAGKTGLLQHLRDLGDQVVDLEELACHKGSSFGALGQAPQPTTEHFENLLWQRLQQIDPQRFVWVEDESMLIGRVCIPGPFFEQMREAHLLFVDVPQEERVHRLVQDYGDHDRKDLGDAVRRIGRRLGPQHEKAALQALQEGDLATVARITLNYYDKAYSRGMAERDPQRVLRWPASVADLRSLAQALQAHASTAPLSH